MSQMHKKKMPHLRRAPSVLYNNITDRGLAARCSSSESTFRRGLAAGTPSLCLPAAPATSLPLPHNSATAWADCGKQRPRLEIAGSVEPITPSATVSGLFRGPSEAHSESPKGEWGSLSTVRKDRCKGYGPAGTVVTVGKRAEVARH